MKVEEFLERIPSDFFTGVPDSQLKALCDSLMERYGISEKRCPPYICKTAGREMP